MGRSTNKLTAVGIERLKTKGRHGDGGGLWLNVSKTGSKAWVFRWTKRGNVREMGLGSYPVVSLAKARQKAFEFRQMISEGLDPKIERDKLDGKTFGYAADMYLKSMSSRWNNAKTRWQWETTLKERCKPIHNRLIAEVDTKDVLKILNLYWTTIPHTATRYRTRIESVIDYAKAQGWREGENPARWKGHLENILPRRDKSETKHHPALDYQELPSFIMDLRSRDALAARSLELLILTACRTGEVLKAKWEEFDFDKAIWTIPPERMKIKREHRVPLTQAMIDLLLPLYEARSSEFVFPGQKRGKPLSSHSMEMMLRRMKRKDITVHGFRSTFRDWCGDETNFAREIAEAALAHKVGNEVEQSYRRSDALEKRRKLMQAWNDYALGEDNSKVVKLHG